jgi:hypothetical protein
MQIIYVLKQQLVGQLWNNNNNNNSHAVIQLLEHARASYHTKLQSIRKFSQSGYYTGP